jgi:hypothetical protein
MRRVGGLGSDDDGTNLRKRENVARQRGGDDDSMLLGLILLQRDRPTMVMMAFLRGGSWDGGVSNGPRAAGSPTGRTIRMMMMMMMTMMGLMVLKSPAIGGGPATSRRGSPTLVLPPKFVGVGMLAREAQGPHKGTASAYAFLNAARGHDAVP